LVLSGSERGSVCLFHDNCSPSPPPFRLLPFFFFFFEVSSRLGCPPFASSEAFDRRCCWLRLSTGPPRFSLSRRSLFGALPAWRVFREHALLVDCMQISSPQPVRCWSSGFGSFLGFLKGNPSYLTWCKALPVWMERGSLPGCSSLLPPRSLTSLLSPVPDTVFSSVWI